MAKWNIVNEYDWCSSPRGSTMRTKAPAVWLKSYKLKSNQIMLLINGYIAIKDSTNAKDFYEKIYKEGTEEEDHFWIPFFGDNIRGFSNTFGDTFQDGIGGSSGVGETAKNALNTGLGVAAQVGGFIGDNTLQTAGSQMASGNYGEALKTVGSAIGGPGNPGTYVETPMFYQFEKNDGPLEVTFILSNTINSDWQKNVDLVKLLTKINRPMRKSSYSVDPPRIYRVVVPGHRLIRWAYCNSFSVNFVGTRRMIGNEIVPEGYQISMSFQSLTMEHAGFVDDVGAMTSND